MYIPGRFRAASSPSRMVMSSSVYDAPADQVSHPPSYRAFHQNRGLRGAYRIPER
jgi:hypothetical protein